MFRLIVQTDHVLTRPARVIPPLPQPTHVHVPFLDHPRIRAKSRAKSRTQPEPSARRKSAKPRRRAAASRTPSASSAATGSARRCLCSSLDGLRPTPDRVRETLFNWLGQSLDGQRCLDLFAGSGALGFEAASRGAARVLMVERSGRAVAQLKANQARLAAKNIEIAEADALRLAAGLAPNSFDVVFLDPPFGDTTMLERALELAVPLVCAGRRAVRRIGRSTSISRRRRAGRMGNRARRQGGRGPLSFAAARK